MTTSMPSQPMTLLQRAAGVDMWKPLIAFVAGGWSALVLAVLLTGRIDVSLAASLAALVVVVALLLIALWDLVVRWGLLKKDPLTFPPVGPVGGWPLWLRLLIVPLAALAGGVALGHWVWK
jgi:ribose/xylose/arabinose/galactoside ABC-type transport system permease subunit